MSSKTDYRHACTTAVRVQSEFISQERPHRHGARTKPTKRFLIDFNEFIRVHLKRCMMVSNGAVRRGTLVPVILGKPSLYDAQTTVTMNSDLYTC